MNSGSETIKLTKGRQARRVHKALPDAALLRAVLDYCPNTGAMNYKQHKEAKMIGKSAVFQSANRGVLVTVNGLSLKAARVAWLLGTGEDPRDSEILTSNGDASDLRLSNLKRRSRKRIAPRPQVKGVRAITAAGATFYRAQATLNGRSQPLGQWLCPLVAEAVVEEAAGATSDCALSSRLQELKAIDAQMQSLIKQRGFSTSSRKDGKLYFKATLRLGQETMRLHTDSLKTMQQAVDKQRMQWMEKLRKETDLILVTSLNKTSRE